MDWSSYVSFPFCWSCLLFHALCMLQHPELLLVSYYTNPNIPHDPDGVVLMWDLKFQKDTPDYIFNCQVCCRPASQMPVRCCVHPLECSDVGSFQ